MRVWLENPFDNLPLEGFRPQRYWLLAEAMFSVMQGDTIQPGFITVTDVACGKDLRDATVKVSVFGDDALKTTAIQHLKHNAKRFQAIINREVKMKFTPRLNFVLDLSREKGDEVLAILNSLPQT